MQNNRWEAIKRGTKGKVILGDGDSMRIGEWIKSIIPMVTDSNDPNKYGWAMKTIENICNHGSEAEQMLVGKLRCI